MSDREIRWLESEIATLKGFLRELPEDDFIERLGFEQRLADARQRLEALTAAPRAKVLPITFRGAPVEGSRSIDATFATKAIGSFVDATDTVAASLSNELKHWGPLPGASKRSLRIVDTATGSFGFELELSPADEAAMRPLLPGIDESDPYARAIEKTLSLIHEASADDEDALSDLVAEIHPRAAAKVRAFAKVLAEHHALFAAEFEGKRVRLDREDQVQRVMDALEEEDISEAVESPMGMLLGVLPESRAFEARLADGSLVRGKVDRSLEDIAGFKKRWENADAQLHFRVVSVRANRRYVLTSASEPGEAHGPDTTERES